MPYKPTPKNILWLLAHLALKQPATYFVLSFLALQPMLNIPLPYTERQRITTVCIATLCIITLIITIIHQTKRTK